MKTRLTILIFAFCLLEVPPVPAQGGNAGLPSTVVAGSALSVNFPGSGTGTLYIVGPGQAVTQEIRFGETTTVPAGALYNAGHYLVVVTGSSAPTTSELDVLPADKPSDLSFLAKPSRLQVGMQNGITGAIYLFDGYHNLFTAQIPVRFELANPSGSLQSRTVTARNGAAWTAMDSTSQQGTDKFVAQAEGVSSLRVIRQVPGDPCGLKMSASSSGGKVQLVTEPVRDCNGNAVPDGTVVTFTEIYGGTQSTVDVPIKRGIAQVDMPVHGGATISVASGVVLGNQIRWGN
jgi:hypothetical protein